MSISVPEDSWKKRISQIKELNMWVEILEELERNETLLSDFKRPHIEDIEGMNDIVNTLDEMFKEHRRLIVLEFALLVKNKLEKVIK